MKKIAIFAIFLMATIMTFGQLVPDQQFLAPARVKSLTTKFTRLIPAQTIVYVDVTPYVLDSTGYVGNTLSNMILKGTAVLQSGAVAASFVAADSNYLHTTGIDAGYGNYTWYGTNTFSGALTGHASLDWSKPDTGINSKLAAYYTTMTAIGLKANTANPTFTTGATAPIFTATSTDTSSVTAAVGSIFMRISGGDTSMWVLIRKTGSKAARWKKLSN